MTTMATANWFEVDRKGLAKLIQRKGKEFILYELTQNSWDTSARNVTATLSASKDNPGYAWLEVTDDNPEGWKDLTHAWTLYAESEKKSDAQKRGRFNLGEKLVLALCREAEIHTTKRAVRFDSRGRHVLGSKRDSGSSFRALVKMTKKEVEEAERAVLKLICPVGVRTTINDKELLARVPKRQIEATLPTELADEEGILRRSARKTVIEIHEVQEGEVASIYELGIPVVETGDKYHVNVMQKVPLNVDRDNVTPAYLQQIRTLVVNEMYKELTPEDATSKAVRDALCDGAVSKEAVVQVMTLQFGEKRVIADPSDPEGTKLAMSQEYSVIPPRAFSKEAWENIRKHEAALPAGRVTPSPKPFDPDGKPLEYLSEEEWTKNVAKVVAYAKDVAYELLGCRITVRVANKATWRPLAVYGPGELIFNLGRLGHAWFDQGPGEKIDELLLHELGHHYSGDHLSATYHDALCRLGAKLAGLVSRKPEIFLKHRWGR